MSARRSCNRVANNYPSYDRAEENELSFREGDKIIEIEAASEDWWQGKDAHGNVGLFPGMRDIFIFIKE